MIGWIRGRIVAVLESGAVIVDVGGLGYEVHVAERPGASGEDVELFVHTSVRDDAIVLYGFAQWRDRETFELLIATPGVGPSTALAALRTMSVGDLLDAVDREDVKAISQIPGIGPKTAGRIVLELRGKVAARDQEPTRTTPVAAAVAEALRSLGYGAAEVREAMEGVELPDEESDALRTVLARMRHA